MIVPEDVRDIIESTMRQWAEHWDEYDTSMDGRYSASAHEDLDAVLAWLDAQPEAPFAPRVLESEDDYRVALAYVESLMDAQPGTAEAEALALWGLLVSDYEDRHYPMTPTAPEEMTIPEDVREAMRQALEFCAGDYCMTGDRYDHFEAALAWLDAQPETGLAH